MAGKTPPPPPPRLNPKKLLLSKWTAVQPLGKEKHFIVTRLLEPDDGGNGAPSPITNGYVLNLRPEAVRLPLIAAALCAGTLPYFLADEWFTQTNVRAASASLCVGSAKAGPDDHNLLRIRNAPSSRTQQPTCPPSGQRFAGARRLGAHRPLRQYSAADFC